MFVWWFVHIFYCNFVHFFYMVGMKLVSEKTLRGPGDKFPLHHTKNAYKLQVTQKRVQNLQPLRTKFATIAYIHSLLLYTILQAVTTPMQQARAAGPGRYPWERFSSSITANGGWRNGYNGIK